jgi:hypothetical protein
LGGGGPLRDHLSQRRQGYDSLKDRMEGPPLLVTLRFDPGDDDPHPPA